MTIHTTRRMSTDEAVQRLQSIDATEFIDARARAVAVLLDQVEDPVFIAYNALVARLYDAHYKQHQKGAGK